MSKFLSPAAVANIAGVSTVAVLKAIHAGRVEATPIFGPTGDPTAWAVTHTEARRWARDRAKGARKR